MAYEIKKLGKSFVVYDDGIVFSTFPTRATAEQAVADLTLESAFAEQVTSSLRYLVKAGTKRGLTAATIRATVRAAITEVLDT